MLLLRCGVGGADLGGDGLVQTSIHVSPQLLGVVIVPYAHWVPVQKGRRQATLADIAQRCLPGMQSASISA
jgi:hypothetical protein